ncbi:conserved hypothetical protein [Theileria equi strain WA]|uniref:U3 small nucleolar RNA-associated protein 6 N-terminal domain-containing protein n=1 Tax=Theileria equi strain WA TaxID=1537102 RepID=L1L961_THEEQ|nr:conserved hypothetical protein [Theileria equi strain WA]EKX72041.1 conserved hypothetical protein [Theileria equi strain WA]|eukprot:XP_004831493.1 conserved hypothetical protein [Theileria equi strain WA]
MADKVQRVLEELAPELQTLSTLKIFTNDEIKRIVEKTRAFEYETLSTDPDIALYAFKRYLEYEIELEGLFKKRYHAYREENVGKRPNDLKRLFKLDIPIKFIFRRRIHRIFRRCTNRFIAEVDLWHMYCKFCYKARSLSLLDRVIMSAIAKNPKVESLWTISVAYTLNYRGITAARNIIQRAIRVIPTSLEMYSILLELEVKATYNNYTSLLANESGGDPKDKKDTLSIQTWKTVCKYALTKLSSDDTSRFLFFATSLTCRLKREKEFIKMLNGYDEFSKNIFDQMNAMGEKYPLLYLYTWQHGLLEKILVEKYAKGGNTSPNSDVLLSFLEKCSEHSLPLFFSFLCTILKREPESSTPSISLDDSLFSIDTQGFIENASSVKDAHVDMGFDPFLYKFCFGIKSLYSICFLDEIPDNFDTIINECRFTRGLASKKQLFALKKLFKEYLVNIIKSEGTYRGKNAKSTPFISSLVLVNVPVDGLIYYFEALSAILEFVESPDLKSRITQEITDRILKCKSTPPKLLVYILNAKDIPVDFKLSLFNQASLNLSNTQIKDSLGAILAMDLEMELVAHFILLLFSHTSVPESIGESLEKLNIESPSTLETIYKVIVSDKLIVQSVYRVPVIHASLNLVRLNLEKISKTVDSLINESPDVGTDKLADLCTQAITLCEKAVDICKYIKDNEILEKCWETYTNCAKILEEYDLKLSYLGHSLYKDVSIKNRISSDSIVSRSNMALNNTRNLLYK